MKIISFIRSISKGLDSSVKVLNWFGYLALAFIVLFTFVDICLRFFFSKPVLGSLEIVESVMAILAASAVAYTSINRGHVSVDLVTNRLSRRPRIILFTIASLLGFGTWAVVAYQSLLVGMSALSSHDITAIIGIPIAPFKFVLSLSLFLYCFIELLHAIHPSESDRKRVESEI